MGSATSYRIRVNGHLGPEWSTALAGLAVAAEPEGTTLLSGRLADQSALHGLLATIRDLGLSLVSLEALPDRQSPQKEG